jgi:hypothetical protein
MGKEGWMGKGGAVGKGGADGKRGGGWENERKTFFPRRLKFLKREELITGVFQGSF